MTNAVNGIFIMTYKEGCIIMHEYMYVFLPFCYNSQIMLMDNYFNNVMTTIRIRLIRIGIYIL